MSDKDNRAKKKKLTDYQPNPRNHNAGTERGGQMLEKSFNKYGAGRSLLADKHGRLIAGNQSLQAAVDAGLVDVIEVETDGNELVVVKRKDLDLMGDDSRAVELSYMDNRAHEVSFNLDAEKVAEDLENGVDFSAMYTPAELEALLPNADDVGVDVGAKEISEEYVLIVECPDEASQAKLFQELKERGFTCQALLS